MTTQTLPAPPNGCAPLTIDMLTPVEAGLQLQLSADALLDVVNRGLLPAYDLGGHIRFRAADVAAVAKGVAA
jgi:excisionase family DNA binding protein